MKKRWRQARPNTRKKIKRVKHGEGEGKSKRRKRKERVKEQKEQSDLLKRNAWELNHVARGLVREISYCESTRLHTDTKKLYVGTQPT